MVRFPTLSATSPLSLALAGLAVASVAAVAYVASRKASGDDRSAGEILGEDVGKAIAKQAGGLVVGAGVGTVKGIGESIGVPDTNAERCELAKANGETWNASLYCTASDFVSWMAARARGDIVTAGGAGSSDDIGAATLDTLRPTLRRGAKGNAVRELQGKLGISQDGNFGPATETAVKKFQSSMRLIADGIVGPETWSALDNGYAPLTQNGVLTDSIFRDMVR